MAPQQRLRGIGRPRVVHAPVPPELPGGTTRAATSMSAKRAADPIGGRSPVSAG